MSPAQIAAMLRDTTIAESLRGCDVEQMIAEAERRARLKIPPLPREVTHGDAALRGAFVLGFVLGRRSKENSK
ncbi:hypothetical protein [Aromatoleum aromaticum]|uniref:hypothetical protein n=1 Tax=Aromatoleum aromaticum TaxID=551760 RepID=UPI0002E8B336|nr:hypothetical protein [Aromatoleum aromaticum]NMG55387.1 hypothetical protein [Aromatoleum aromaticum]